MDSAMATMIVNKSFNQIVKNTSQLQSLKLTINNENYEEFISGCPTTDAQFTTLQISTPLWFVFSTNIICLAD